MVYQLACLDSWGPSPQGVVAICQALDVNDPSECLQKVLELASRSQPDPPPKQGSHTGSP